MEKPRRTLSAGVCMYIGLQPYVFHRILLLPAFDDFEMQMDAGRIAGAAHRSDFFAFADRLALSHVELA